MVKHKDQQVDGVKQTSRDAVMQRNPCAVGSSKWRRCRFSRNRTSTQTQRHTYCVRFYRNFYS
uniref:Uncharacterized protein n=1 Tax=Nelumbo nucifera TaxID=4432 RepID=A0A822YEZ2_NELNU|nr:TPA_asm: hypothetical protein HUJ06_009833 [Nelumbo nucifera]